MFRSTKSLHTSVGAWLLVDSGTFGGLWSAMYNAPVLPLTNFNNTVTLGAILVSIVLAVPVFFAARLGVALYRNKLAKWVEKTWIGKLLKATKLYGIFGGVVEGS